MKSEQLKAITEKATEQLITALDASHSETLNAYLKAIGLDTGSASSDYIQIWNGDAALLIKSFSFIRQAASLLLEALTDE